MAELYEFPRDSQKIIIKCWDKKKGEENNDKSSPLIERFKSPITFKVFGRENIYLLREEIPKEMYGRTFEFRNKNSDYAIRIKTPSEDVDFQLKDFIHNHVENSWKYVS